MVTDIAIARFRVAHDRFVHTVDDHVPVATECEIAVSLQLGQSFSCLLTLFLQGEKYGCLFRHFCLKFNQGVVFGGTWM